MDITKRSEKIPFMGIKSGDTVKYHRLKGFTEFTKSSNAKEYSRQYIDEDFEQSDVVGYSPSVSYAFDLDSSNEIHKDLVSIADNELCGSAAVRSIVIVDLSTQGTSEGSYEAVCRDFAVIPDSEGDSTDAYTYSGSMKAKTKVIKGTATTTDEWQTLTFTAEE